MASCWGRGYAMAAVRALAEQVRARDGGIRLVAHAPLERPASGRVLAKAGFTIAGGGTEEHDGQIMRVQRWDLAP